MWIQEIVQEEVPLVLEQDTWIDLAKYIYVTCQNYIQVKISQPRLIPSTINHELGLGDKRNWESTL